MTRLIYSIICSHKYGRTLCTIYGLFPISTTTTTITHKLWIKTGVLLGTGTGRVFMFRTYPTLWSPCIRSPNFIKGLVYCGGLGPTGSRILKNEYPVRHHFGEKLLPRVISQGFPLL